VLIGSGWFAKDSGSRQRKLNRDGANFVLNLDWSPADLWSFGRLEALCAQAIAAGWIRPSEAQILDFIAAAVPARQVKNGDPVRIFVATVRQRLWHHITNDQEDHARRALNRYRDQNPDRFRILATRPNGQPVKLVFEERHQPLSRGRGIEPKIPSVEPPEPRRWGITPFEKAAAPVAHCHQPGRNHRL
jgi:hypothetical protein